MVWDSGSKWIEVFGPSALTGGTGMFVSFEIGECVSLDRVVHEALLLVGAL